MISEILASFGDKLKSLGYGVTYAILDKSNSTKLPLAEIDIKGTSPVVAQTIESINQIDFSLYLYHKLQKTDQEYLGSIALMEDFEDLKEMLNNALRDWTLGTALSIPSYCGISWSYQGQGINREFAQNNPVKMLVVNCSIKYLGV